MSEPVTRHLTVLLTDIKGFTDKTSHKSRADITRMLDEHREVVLPILESRGGRLIKTIGDAFLMTFESPTNAVLAGVAVQDALALRNEGRAADDRLEIRIAINAGEINMIDNDIFGEAVNITARIEGIAETGQVYFTEAVYLAMNKSEVPSSEIGLVQLKGIPERIRVYKVRRERPVSLVSASAQREPARRSSTKAVFVGALSPSWERRAAALAIDLLLCALVLGFVAGHAASVSRIVKKKIPPPAANGSYGDTLIRTLAGNRPAHVGYGDALIHSLTGGRPEAVKKKSDLEIVITQESINPAWPWAFPLIWIAYNLLFLKSLGVTPGMRALKLRQSEPWPLFPLVSGYALLTGARVAAQ